jgi:hypothetical protein
MKTINYKFFEGTRPRLIDVFSRNFTRGPKEFNDKRTSFMVVGVPAEIRTEHIPSIILERYRYSKRPP